MALKTASWLGYVVLHCRNLQAARRFYHHVMGLPIAYERAGWIQFQVGDTGLVLRPLDEGLCDGRAALIQKLHHSVGDGRAGVALMGELYDLAREVPPRTDVELVPRGRQPDERPLVPYATSLSN